MNIPAKFQGFNPWCNALLRCMIQSFLGTLVKFALSFLVFIAERYLDCYIGASNIENIEDIVH